MQLWAWLAWRSSAPRACGVRTVHGIQGMSGSDFVVGGSLLAGLMRDNGGSVWTQLFCHTVHSILKYQSASHVFFFYLLFFPFSFNLFILFFSPLSSFFILCKHQSDSVFHYCCARMSPILFTILRDHSFFFLFLTICALSLSFFLSLSLSIIYISISISLSFSFSFSQIKLLLSIVKSFDFLVAVYGEDNDNDDDDDITYSPLSCRFTNI